MVGSSKANQHGKLKGIKFPPQQHALSNELQSLDSGLQILYPHTNDNEEADGITAALVMSLPSREITIFGGAGSKAHGPRQRLCPSKGTFGRAFQKWL